MSTSQDLSAAATPAPLLPTVAIVPTVNSVNNAPIAPGVTSEHTITVRGLPNLKKCTEDEFFNVLEDYAVSVEVLRAGLPRLQSDVAQTHKKYSKKGRMVPGPILQVVPIIVRGATDVEGAHLLLVKLLNARREAMSLQPTTANGVPIATAVPPTLAAAVRQEPPSTGPTPTHLPIVVPRETSIPTGPTASIFKRTDDVTRRPTPGPSIPVPTVNASIAEPPRVVHPAIDRPLTVNAPVGGKTPPPIRFITPTPAPRAGRQEKDRKGKARATEEQDELDSGDETEPDQSTTLPTAGRSKRPPGKRSLAQIKMEAVSDDELQSSTGGSEMSDPDFEAPATPPPKAIRRPTRKSRQRKRKTAPKTPAIVDDTDDNEQLVVVDRFAVVGINPTPCENCVNRSVDCEYVVDKFITVCSRCHRGKARCSISGDKQAALKASGARRTRTPGAGMAPKASTVNARQTAVSRSRSQAEPMAAGPSVVPVIAAPVSRALSSRPVTRSSTRVAQPARAARVPQVIQEAPTMGGLDGLRQEMERMRQEHAAVADSMTRRLMGLYENQAHMMLELRRLRGDRLINQFIGAHPASGAISMAAADAARSALSSTANDPPQNDAPAPAMAVDTRLAVPAPPPSKVVTEQDVEHRAEEPTPSRHQSGDPSADILPPAVHNSPPPAENQLESVSPTSVERTTGAVDAHHSDPTQTDPITDEVPQIHPVAISMAPVNLVVEAMDVGTAGEPMDGLTTRKRPRSQSSGSQRSAKRGRLDNLV